MRIHHINCGTMHPPSRRLFNGTGGWFERATMVCHCLLIETDSGLVLVDSGFRPADLAEASGALRLVIGLLRPNITDADTAAGHVRRLGFAVEDVRHIVLTHLDYDHAGGMPDFPHATVHLHARELDAAKRPVHRDERRRYQSRQWAHGPKWATYEEDGEPWFGFEAVRQLEGLPPEILLVPLHGHTRGHSGIAVDGGDGWLLAAGDAYFHRDRIDPDHPRCPKGLAGLEHVVQIDKASRVRNQERMRRLRADHADEVRIFCAHDPVEFERHAAAG
ncbi:MAG: MBL fold metallo-hydrolase [Stackebrandtia sp.]